MCPLAVVSTLENSANDNSVPPVSSASNSSQPSPAFLATVVQAVKLALAVEQQEISSSGTFTYPQQGPFQANIAALPLSFSSGGVPALHSQALALVASGAGFVSSPGASVVQASVQGMPPVAPSFVSTFSNPLPLPVVMPSGNMATAGTAISMVSTLPQPTLHQPFIIGPGFLPIPGKLVGQTVTRKFTELGDILPTNRLSLEPELQVLFDRRLVLTPAPKKSKRYVKDISTWEKDLNDVLLRFSRHLVVLICVEILGSRKGTCGERVQPSGLWNQLVAVSSSICCTDTR